MTEPVARRRPHTRALGPLGRRLVVAFSVVALAAVGLMALAAQQAVNRGVTAAAGAGQDVLAAEVADAVASRVAEQGGWPGADLTGALDIATRAGLAVTVRDADGRVVASTGGPGRSLRGAGPGAEGTTAVVEVAGDVVGSVWVAPRGGGAEAAAARAEQRGAEVAWPWIVGAALTALVLAVVAGWLVTRWLTAPLAQVIEVARAFGRGAGTVRADESATGELGDLARGFNEAADAVESGAAARRQMAADVAHELRTPLTALQAGLEELRDGYVPAEPATLGRLHDQVVRLGRVVDDLALLASPADQVPQTGRARFDLGDVVADELAARMPELRAARLVVDAAITPGLSVVGDPGRLHQAVGNVLANCARHCRAGDRVHVEVRPAGTGDRLEVVVADSGPGIDEADRERAFDRYWRGPVRGVAGSGIGLAVVREVAVAHRGQVSLAETPGGGTTITIVLPTAPVGP